MVRVNEYKAVGAGRLWRVAFLTAAAAIGTTARAAKAVPPSGQENRAPREGIGQAARAGHHRDLDRKATPQNLRRQWVLRGSSGFHGHEGPFDADGRLQRHSETEA